MRSKPGRSNQRVRDVGRHGLFVERVPAFISCGFGTGETVGRHKSAAVVAVTVTTSGMRLIGVAIAWPCHFEPPRESRRLVGVSHAAMASSRVC